MKKIVGTIAAIALAASSAFAGANLGMGFNRGFFTPFAWDGAAKAGISTSWGAEPRVGVSFSAASEDVGVVADAKFDGGAVAVNDNAYIWVKPASWLKVQIGQSFDDTLRGNGCFGSWDWLRPGNILGEDLTFVRVCENPLAGAYAPLQGAIVMVDPIEGLHVTAGLRTGYGSDAWENLAKKIQVQAGYTIPDVLQIKAQWIGNGDNGVINAAVALKAVEGMTLDVGAFINTDSANTNPVSIAAFWGMGFDAVSVNVNAKVTLAKDDTAATKVAAGAGIGVDLGNGLSCGADVRYSQDFQKDVNNDPKIAFAAWLDKGIANGTLGVAVQGAMKTDLTTFDASDFTVAVPVRVQCFF
ncbi:MAG: outer membrane beta-barrel protein [Treponema sp.]|uniref:hypothetical protein n=1 Tax=Treponema sp. TaxID=166 RepID=UPI00298DC056|nr:hypothetical protein [Treponema sp.]MCQ2601749.1 outer membrane beta-barrel protein [Treponema sp.]